VPSLTFDLEAHPAPLLVMARDGDHGRYPWNEDRIVVVGSCHLAG
jgi:hypothetical protein